MWMCFQVFFFFTCPWHRGTGGSKLVHRISQKVSESRGAHSSTSALAGSACLEPQPCPDREEPAVSELPGVSAGAQLQGSVSLTSTSHEWCHHLPHAIKF